ncbi:MAG: hypothetical protein WA160_14105 [Pseudobdellovibrio sp.]
MQDHIPAQPANSFRIIITQTRSGERLDGVLLKALREQNENINLKNIARVPFKELFSSGKIFIKGQRAKTSSTLAHGITYVDILGF